LVILVGAGASFGAFDVPSRRPPLGDDLFESLVGAFPDTWGSLPDAVVATFRSDGFELGMAALREEAVHTQDSLIDMSIYFSAFRLLPGVNRYLALTVLLQSLGPSVEFSFASLNYETYLEQSLARIGLGVLYGGEPRAGVDEAFVRVIKPHGSCNFVADTGTNTFEGVTMVGGQAYIAGAPLKAVSLDEVAKARETGFPSAMSLYAPGKPDMICPEFVARIREDWKSTIRDADAIVVIGARPMLDSDPHIWIPIIDSSAPFALIGGDGATVHPVVGDRLTLLGDTFASGLNPLRSWLRDRATPTGAPP